VVGREHLAGVDEVLLSLDLGHERRNRPGHRYLTSRYRGAFAAATPPPVR
jgi:hypothetical protein